MGTENAVILIFIITAILCKPILWVYNYLSMRIEIKTLRSLEFVLDDCRTSLTRSEISELKQEITAVKKQRDKYRKRINWYVR